MLRSIKLIAAAAIFAVSTPSQASTMPDTECLARVIHHEARGESHTGKKAVGYVVVNRSKSGVFPNSICRVVTQNKQFSNFSLRKSIPAAVLHDYKKLASEIILSYSRFNDPTRGALYFHSRYVNPGWRGLRYVITIGNHRFYTR